MLSPLQTKFYQIVQDCFRDLASVRPKPFPAKEQMNAPFEASAIVPFDGLMRGVVRIVLYGELLGTLASEMVGEPEVVPTPAEKSDALGEIANVICGNALPILCGPEAVFKLSSPIVSTSEDQSYKSPDTIEAANLKFFFPRGRMELSILVVIN